MKFVMINKFLASAIVTISISICSIAQKTYTLEECISTAIKNNIGLASADLTSRNSEVTLTQNKHQMYPDLSIGTNSFVNFGRSIDPTSNQFITSTFLSNNLTLSSNILLYNGGRVKNSIEQAKLDASSALMNKDQIERNIILEVSTAYLNATFGVENITLAQNRKKQTQQQLDLIKKLISYGTRPENEVYDLEAQIATDDQALVQAQNNYDLALLRLKQVMNIPPTEDINIQKVPDITNLTDPIAVDLNSLVERGSANQPSIKARQMSIKSAQIGEKIAKAAYYPTIGFGGSLRTNYSNQAKTVERLDTRRINQDVFVNGTPVTLGLDQDFPVLSNTPYFSQFGNNLSYGFGLNINMPIFTNYQAKGGMERAKIRTEQAKLDLLSEKQQLNTQISQSYADAKVAKANLAATTTTLNAQRKSYEVATKRFEAGAINNYDFIQQKTRVDIAESNFLNAKYEYIFRTKVLDFYLGNNIKLN